MRAGAKSPRPPSMKRFVILLFLLLGLGLAETPVVIHLRASGPDPAKLHVPTDAPYLLTLINESGARVVIRPAPGQAENAAQKELFALLFPEKGEKVLVMPPGARLALRYWPKAQGEVRLRVEIDKRVYTLRLILEPPDYYEGPSGCS